jgi:hypothetical protein
VNVEHGRPPGRDGAGRRPGSPGPRRLTPVAPPSSPTPARPQSIKGAALAGPTPTSRGPRRLAPPRPVKVRADEAGRPNAVDNRAVEAVRESWLVEDRWWTDAPLRRRYWEVVTADGRDLVVFRDLQAGRWFAQR